MTREEAIDILMSANVWNDEERTAWEVLIPELAESEDERIRKIIYNCVYECCDTGYLLKDDRNSVVAWLEKQKEQKPADLSKMMVHKEPYIAPVPTPMVADEQKPTSISCGHENDAEWGQEDKEKIVTISEIIEHCTTIPYSGGTLTLNKEYKKELLCFIRTLRPSWKPSEHQMNILKAVKEYVGAGSGYWGEGLGSLIEDLEKL